MIQPSTLSSDASLDLLANHCIAARTMIDEVGTPMMRRLIDLLLFEIGVALSVSADPLAQRSLAQDPLAQDPVAQDPVAQDPLTADDRPVLAPAE